MSTIRCANCGADNVAGAQFCAACGAALVTPAGPPPAPPTYPAAPQQAPAAYPAPPWAMQPTPQQGTGTATAALVLGIVGLLAWLLPLIGLPVNVIGIVLGALGRRGPSKGTATAGLVCSVIGLGLTIINGIAGAIMMVNLMHGR